VDRSPVRPRGQHVRLRPREVHRPAAIITRLHASGLRLALWSTPYLENAATPFHDEAVTKGFFAPQSGIPLNRWSAPIDFTNPAAFTFWRDLVKRYTALGIEGFKLDYGEDVAPSLGLTRGAWRFADGSDERTMHHDFSGLYHRAYAEALPEERFLLCRAAHWGEQETGCIIWPGDIDASFTHHRERFTPRGSAKEVLGVGGLPASVVMGLSLGVSGFPFYGADTGGYRHSPPDEEDRLVGRAHLRLGWAHADHHRCSARAPAAAPARRRDRTDAPSDHRYSGDCRRPDHRVLRARRRPAVGARRAGPTATLRGMGWHDARAW